MTQKKASFTFWIDQNCDAKCLLLQAICSEKPEIHTESNEPVLIFNVSSAMRKAPTI